MPSSLFARLSSLPGAIVLLSAAVLSAAPVINEIHYNNDVNYIPNEFVEIYNPGPGSADLSGWQITGGVEFLFPESTLLDEGAYLVVAENPSTLNAEFQIDALGPYSGGLSGEGETVDLVDSSGERIDRVNFDKDFPWPIAADGAGSSMELINPALDNDLGSSWRSSNTNGIPSAPTPGRINSVATTTAPPNIRQVRHTPQQPTGSEDTVITAKVTDPDGVAGVNLQYALILPGRYVPAFLAKSHSQLLANPTAPRTPNPAYLRNWLTTPMLDDGLGDDAVAGDNIFTATIPAEDYSNRTLLRYRIAVSDSDGASVTVPFFD
ncbi:MAG: lamin tail domain-containing protein, partial [Roseibacillus sp.]|nr:lamin tail domain-containing protein [Roseibacillus sp.]